jgi:hypothetical protein
MNSAPNSAPARMPGHSVPSRASIGVPRIQHHVATQSVARTERMVP